MQTLVVYSSRTGNTEKLARALAEALPDSELLPVAQAPANPSHDWVLVGYWAFRGGPDEAAGVYLRGLSGQKVALFGTLAAWPDSEHAAHCREAAERLLIEPERGNTVLGTFLCQGRLHAEPRHPLTPERRARLAEAAKHPNEADFQAARAFFTELRERCFPFCKTYANLIKSIQT